MADRARPSIGGRPPKPSISFYNPPGKAVLRRPLEPGQYTSADYGTLARVNGIVLSIGRKGECLFTGYCAMVETESFFATIKRELIDTRAWPTRERLRRAVFDYIEGWYNVRRLHSSLDYNSPAEWEANHRRQAA
jgi:putative transposase